MRGRSVLLASSLLFLTACEKDFDEKYQENLERLNEEAKEIEVRVEQQLTEGREADQVLQPAQEAGNSAAFDRQEAE